MKMARTSDPHASLGAALIKAAAPAEARIATSTARPWASITFSGQRHRFAIHFGGPEAAAMARFMARTIACDEFDIGGHLVADIVASQPVEKDGEMVVEIEALTVETR
jgi:hypothetical protein